MLFETGFVGNKVWKIIDPYHARPGVIAEVDYITRLYTIRFDDGGTEEYADPREFAKKPPAIAQSH